LRKLRDELRQLRAGEFCLLPAQGGQSQQNLGERPEVTAARRDDPELLNSFAFVAADSGEAEDEPLVQRMIPADGLSSVNGLVRRVAPRHGHTSGAPTPGPSLSTAFHNYANLSVAAAWAQNVSK
jgi:hypothetical protein